MYGTTRKLELFEFGNIADGAVVDGALPVDVKFAAVVQSQPGIKNLGRSNFGHNMPLLHANTTTTTTTAATTASTAATSTTITIPTMPLPEPSTTQPFFFFLADGKNFSAEAEEETAAEASEKETAAIFVINGGGGGAERGRRG